jgi:hypothetical protein
MAQTRSSYYSKARSAIHTAIYGYLLGGEGWTLAGVAEVFNQIYRESHPEYLQGFNELSINAKYSHLMDIFTLTYKFEREQMALRKEPTEAERTPTDRAARLLQLLFARLDEHKLQIRDLLIARTLNQDTVIHAAIDLEDAKILHIFFELLFDFYSSTITLSEICSAAAISEAMTAANGRGHTPFHRVAYRNNTACIIEYIAALKKGLHDGVITSQQFSELLLCQTPPNEKAGDSVLHLILHKGQYESVVALLDLINEAFTRGILSPYAYRALLMQDNQRNAPTLNCAFQNPDVRVPKEFLSRVINSNVLIMNDLRKLFRFSGILLRNLLEKNMHENVAFYLERLNWAFTNGILEPLTMERALTSKGKYGLTALYVVVEQGNHDTINLFLNFINDALNARRIPPAAFVESLTHKTELGYTLLHRLLKKGSSQNLQHYAAMLQSCVENKMLLLSEFKDFCLCSAENGETGMHLAVIQDKDNYKKLDIFCGILSWIDSSEAPLSDEELINLWMSPSTNHTTPLQKVLGQPDAVLLSWYLANLKPFLQIPSLRAILRELIEKRDLAGASTLDAAVSSNQPQIIDEFFAFINEQFANQSTTIISNLLATVRTTENTSAAMHQYLNELRASIGIVAPPLVVTSAMAPATVATISTPPPSASATKRDITAVESPVHSTVKVGRAHEPSKQEAAQELFTYRH